MALSRLKVWVAEILTYSELNSEFNNILNNANSLISPFTANVSGGGYSITNLGGLIVGATATTVTAGSAHATQMTGTSAATTGSVISMFSADAVGANISFAKSRHATILSHTIVQSGDDLGSITAYGSNGSTFDPAARILFECGGTPGASTDMPGAIVFYTTPDGSVTLTERMRINAAGSVLIAGLTTDRVAYTGASGVLSGASTFTFDGTTFTCGMTAMSVSAALTVTSANANTLNLVCSGTADALLNINAGSAGDAYIAFQPGAQAWTAGGDTSDSDAFVISNSLTLGTTNRFKLTTAGLAFFPGHGTTGSAANGVVVETTGDLLRSTSSLKYKIDTVSLGLDESWTAIEGGAANAISYSSNTALCKGDDPKMRFIGIGAEPMADVDARFVQFNGKGEPNYTTYDRFVAPLCVVVADIERRLKAKGI